LAFQIISSICCLGCTKLGNLNIVVNVVSALRARMPKISLSIPTGGRDTVPVQSVQPSSGYHQTSNPKCTERKNFASVLRKCYNRNRVWRSRCMLHAWGRGQVTNEIYTKF
jgi:hypothetical protein